MLRVLTGGKFNKIHPGHVWLLKKAKTIGYLIVVLAHDSHNNREYAVPAKKRKRHVEALKIANRVVVGSPTNFAGVLKKFKPHVIVLGYDQKLPDKATEIYVQKHKIAVIKFKKHGSHSTKKIARR